MRIVCIVLAFVFASLGAHAQTASRDFFALSLIHI